MASNAGNGILAAITGLTEGIAKGMEIRRDQANKDAKFKLQAAQIALKGQEDQTKNLLTAGLLGIKADELSTKTSGSDIRDTVATTASLAKLRTEHAAAMDSLTSAQKRLKSNPEKYQPLVDEAQKVLDANEADQAALSASLKAAKNKGAKTGSVFVPATADKTNLFVSQILNAPTTDSAMEVLNQQLAAGQDANSEQTQKMVQAIATRRKAGKPIQIPATLMPGGGSTIDTSGDLGE